MPVVIHDIPEMQERATRERQEGKRIGVVPTMGFLHEGHLSLMRQARHRTDVVITTVFVNPAQFGPAEDFDRYPRDLARDVLLAASAGTDFVFAPELSAMYPEGYGTYVDVGYLGNVLEGKARPGHFRGVATVVTKLFHITKPHTAIFGQKDAQQTVVVKRLVRDLNMDVEIVVVPTVREYDGLAMSSRNTYLTPEQRIEAAVLYRSLRRAEEMLHSGNAVPFEVIQEMHRMITAESSGVVDYISIADSNTLEEVTVLNGQKDVLVSLAVRFGSTRLIDNIHVTL